MTHYLDNAATTPVRQEAVDAAVEAMTTGWGNPSSRHALGTQAAQQLKHWRQDAAEALGCEQGEVYFTSCGTESDNWAIQGAVALNRRRGKHIITTAIEHDGVLQPCQELERQGYEVTYLQPNRQGTIDPDAVAGALRPDTVLVSMMLVNNELGTILPVSQAAQAIRRAGSCALLHCDGVQALFKIPLHLRTLGVDLFTISGHKIHAPKGIGALYVRRGVKLPPLILGGGAGGGASLWHRANRSNCRLCRRAAGGTGHCRGGHGAHGRTEGRCHHTASGPSSPGGGAGPGGGSAHPAPLPAWVQKRGGGAPAQ